MPSANGQIRTSRMFRLVPVFVIVLSGLALSAWAYFLMDQQEQASVEHEFETAAKIRFNAIERNVYETMLLLEFLRSHLREQQDPDSQKFTNFVAPARRFVNGIQAVEWVPRVVGQERQAHEKGMQAKGNVGYSITEIREGEIKSAPRRSVYYPVQIIYPMKGNESALGFDTLTIPQSREALIKARDTGMGIASPSFSLVQETGSQKGLLLYMPVYEGNPTTVKQRRLALRGLALIVLRAGDFIEATLSNVESTGVGVLFEDLTARPEDRWLYRHGMDDTTAEGTGLRLSATQQVGGRLWRITCVAQPDFIARFITDYPLIMFVSGLVLTLFVAAYVYAIAGQTMRVRQEVEDRTQQLKESEQRFDLALKGGDLGLWDWNIVSGEVVFNDRWAEILEYELHEIAPHVESWSGLVHPDDMPMIEEHLNAHLKGESPLYNCEHRMLAKSGRWKWILDRGRVVERAEDGSPLRAVGTHLDITEWKEAEFKLTDLSEQLSLAMESSESGLWDWDVGTGDVHYDDQWCELLGYQRDEVEQRIDAWQATIHPDDLGRVLAKIALSHEPDFQGLYETTYRAIKKDGSTVWVRARGRVVERDAEGIPLRMMGTIQDATRSKQLEEDLRIARDEAQRANRAKSDFLANMSHEIRTPMNAVIGLTNLALGTELTSKQRDYLTKVSHSSQSLLGVINDILDFSRIEAGKLELDERPLLLADVFHTVDAMFAESAKEKGLTFATKVGENVPKAVMGDSLRIEQILVNLIGNAIKFTAEGSVTLSITADDGNRLNFAVADTGVGITEKAQAKLFDAFTQADTSTTRKYGGSGLGLAISNRLAQLMGGTLALESVYGEGSTFTFAAEFPPVSVADVSGNGCTAALRALVADKDPEQLQQLTDLLSSFNFIPVKASTFKEASIALRTASPPLDLFVIGEELDDMEGVEAASLLREEYAGQERVKILFVVQKSTTSTAQAIEFGVADAELEVPIHPSRLYNTLVELLGAESLRSSALEVCPEVVLDAIHGARILLVEDNAINQEVAREILQSEGLHVTIADNGSHALEILEANEFNAILMDIQMPVMDGYTATRVIRATQRIADIPIIAMTAHAMSGDRERCLEAGMDDYVSKPVDTNQLFTTLSKWIRPENITHDQTAPVAKPSGGDDTLPHKLRGFDLEEGVRRLSGNASLYKRLLLDFSREYVGFDHEIHKALQSDDRESARRHAHTIKGVAGNIGAMDLHGAAARLETVIRTGDGVLKEALDEFSEKLEIAMASLASIAPASSKETGDSSPYDADQLIGGLVALRELVEARSFGAGKALAELQPQANGIGAEQDFVNLEKTLAQFDFSGALDAINDMLSFLQSGQKGDSN